MKKTQILLDIQPSTQKTESGVIKTTHGLPEETVRDMIHAITEEILAMEGIKNPVEISVSLVGNDAIAELNRKHRGLNRPTDVLSFPLYEERELMERISREDLHYPFLPLGDIVISFEKVVEQAEVYGHSVEREFGFLLAHGLLHLLAYDHMTDDEEKHMLLKQETVLQKLRLNR